MLEKIEKAFEFSWDSDYGGWFKKDGTPYLSPIGITFEMFRQAAWVFFNHNRRKYNRFMKSIFLDVMNFAENNVDSMHPFITMKYGFQEREGRIKEAARIVYPYILRHLRPWYKHPRWHFWHWRLQIHPLQDFKRWAFSRCCKCGKGFSWGYSVVTTSWDGTGPLWFRSEKNVFHGDCDRPEADQVAATPQPEGGKR